MKLETREDFVRRNIDLRRQAIADGVSVENKDRMEQEIVILEAELVTILAEKQRTSEQEEAVESIVLPYDFNALFSEEGHEITNANKVIIEVVKDFERQANARHNAEIAKLNAEHKEELKAATDRGIELKRQIEILQANLEGECLQAEKDAVEYTQLMQRMTQLENEKADAIAKRDAAARELDIANEEISQHKIHIDDLRQQLANAPAPKAAIDIGATDRLAQLVKESNEAKALRGVSRWANMLPEIVTPPVLPFLDEDIQEVAELPNLGESFRADKVYDRLESSTGGQDQGVQAETFEQWATREINELKRAVHGNEQAA